jgi:hypothetical protein
MRVWAARPAPGAYEWSYLLAVDGRSWWARRAVAAHEVVAAARAVLETRGEPSSLARLAKAMHW